MSMAHMADGQSQPLDETLNELLRAMQTAHLRDGFADLALRCDRLGRIGAMVRENQNTIIAAIDADFGGRSREETLLAEVFTTLSSVRHAKGGVAKWMRPRRRAMDLAFKPARATLLPQPLGVAGIISPWNYPLLMALSPLVGALAAGNRAMVKPSEFTPRTSELLAEMIAKKFTADEVAVVQGGVEVGAAFAALPFDHLFFTGSTNVGRKVMAAAAANLTPVTLELGGKSPAIIAPDANLDVAVTSIVRGKLFNAGQTCVAPDYVLLPQAQLDAFVEKALAVAVRFYPDLADNPDYSSIVNQAQFDRLQGMIRDAETQGARVLTASVGVGRKLPLTLVLDSTDAMAVRREEIFGPVLPVIPYGDLDAAIGHVNGGERPLALYAYGRDRANIDRVLRSTISGGAVVNDCLIHAGVEALPFGGVGTSGMGQYHGQEGFETFSKLKPVMYQSRLNGMWVLNPPYGAKAKALIKLLLKRP
ncbi:MAG: coniferyl aldehyde dehydrogenase [Alphaproteobacteria bacterium]|jgi:acyl-CoA reductase-like NAD-dependent aldehyde dehydrogenase|nr:coniferyl aldehyde dehydrogenase [Alphaproteobacteria bacterium]MDP6253522.1 coniferyl aldehyde dehydrogenase [Alphaproteobacteria bacterium]MDP7460603.1 coniferyl aldehyde dehydrogenase [Alphaproteobacteria bacterium]HJM91608.1 coniferyl aldehyde dehydrogenase [Alphaproteobacteria bacterium]|tara:strand:- start:5265 stop:6695 length:1431 start_codon:yes stop_codon:yes gene_type:complete